jgi:hypothetical protein
VNQLTNLLVKIGVLKNDLDYHLIRASSCSQASGTRNWGFSELSVYALSLVPSRLSRLCQMAGLRLPAGSRYDGKGGISNEGSRSVRCVVLFAEAGRHESAALWQTSAE